MATERSGKFFFWLSEFIQWHSQQVVFAHLLDILPDTSLEVGPEALVNQRIDTIPEFRDVVDVRLDVLFFCTEFAGAVTISCVEFVFD